MRSAGWRRTLVVHTGGIGDFLLLCPSLLRLREEGTLVLAGNRNRLNLAVVAGIAETAHDLDDMGFHSVFSEPNAALRSALRNVDRAVVWMRDDGAIRRGLESCNVPDVRTYPGLPPEDWPHHATAYYEACLELETLPPLRLPMPEGDSEHDVVIHPGSGGAKKNWPLDHFAAVAEALTAEGRKVEWCLGPAEEGWGLPAGARRLDTPSIVTLARELASTHTYIGNDSGGTHLAAACGCRAVAIFGPTNPAVWAPRGDRVRVVTGTPWPAPEQVLDALAEGEAQTDS